MGERGIGDNGGPALERLTAAKKVERIKEILEMDLSSAQKCIGVGIVVHADTEGVAAEMSTERLKTIASVKDRETVYTATKRLEEKSVATKIKVDGKPNNYRVLPSRVMDAIEEAYRAAKTSRVEPDHHVGANTTTLYNNPSPVGPAPPIGLDRTGQTEPDGVSRAYTPARIEPPSGVVIPLENNTLPLPPQSVPAVENTGGEEDLVQVNCVTIKGPNFTIDLRAIDQLAMLAGLPSERGRAIAEVYAREWAANNSKPNHPMAYLKKMIAGDRNDAAIAEVRLAKATTLQSQPGESRSEARRKRLAGYLDEIQQPKGRS